MDSPRGAQAEKSPLCVSVGPQVEGVAPRGPVQCPPGALRARSEA
jgi:hypothetical protein